MRLSQFRRAVADEFGEGYGSVLTHDLVIAELGDSTADQAISNGVPPREVWLALCVAMDVPPSHRHGAGLPTPPER